MAGSGKHGARSESLPAFVFWSVLSLAAAAAQWGATQAGPYVTYAHLRVPTAPSAAWWTCTGVLALELALVIWAVFFAPDRRAPRWSAWVRGHLAAWQVLVLLSALGLSRAKIARPLEATLAEAAVATLLALTTLAVWVLAAESLPSATLARLSARVERLLGPAGARAENGAAVPGPGGPDRWAFGLAGIATLGAALLCWFAYERHPHVPDEVPYLIHARTFAAGKLALAAPPVPEAFDVDLMLQVGERWFSPVPPGWPLALAAGARLGAEWLVNPLLSGLCVLLGCGLAREVASRRAARLFVLFLALSPWALFLGMSFMTHTWTLFCALLAALGVARARRLGSEGPAKPIGWCALSGLAIGVVSWIRPLDGLVLAALLGLWALAPGVLGGARVAWGGVASLVISTAAVGALVLPYNRELSGRALRHPIMDYVDRVYGPGKNDLGFGPDKGLDWGGLDPWPGHTPLQAVVNSQFNLAALDLELFGWTTGAVLWLLLSCFWRWSDRSVRAALFAILVVVAANGLYWFSGGPDFGARYWYLVLPPCLLLAVTSLGALRERLGAGAGRADAVLLLALASTCCVFIPWRAVDKYHHYRGMEPGARELASGRPFGRSLVLVRGERHPDYASASVYNPLDWQADAPIFAWDRGAEVRDRLRTHYGDRPVWILDGPTRTGQGFAVVAGPIPWSEVEAQEAQEAR